MSEEKIASLTIDGSGALNTLDRLEQKLDGVGGATEESTRRLSGFGREFSSVARSLGIYANSFELVARAQQGAKEAVASGRINQEQANRVIEEARLRYDEAARAARDAAKAQEQAAQEQVRAAAATAQGLEAVRRQYDSGYAALAKYGDEVARVTKVLDEAGATEGERARTLAAVTAALDPLTRAEREREEALTRTLQAEEKAAAEAERNRREMIEQAKATQTAADAQERFNRLLGVGAKGSGSGTAAMSASVFEESARAAEEQARANTALVQSMEQVRRQYDPAYAATAKYKDEVARVSRILDEAGINGHEYAATLQAVASALDPVARAERQRGQETARAAEEEAQAQAELASELDRVRTKYNPVYAEVRRYAEEMNRVTRVLELANVREEERTRILREVADAHDPLVRAETERAAAESRAREAAETANRELVERERALQRATTAQAEFNRLLGIQPAGVKSTNSAAASGAVFEEAAREEQALQRLIGGLDRTFGATERLAQEQALLDKALREGVGGIRLSTEQHAALSKAMQDQHAILTRGATGTKLAAHEMTNLGYQIQDVVVSLAGGQNPLLVLMQQGPQATSAVGGVERAMALLMTPTAAVAAGVLTVAGAFGLAGYGAYRFGSDMREFERTVRLTGSATGITSRGLADMAEQVAATEHVSRASARETATAYAETGRIGAGVLGDLTAATRDWAAATGQETDDAAKELASLFTDPSKGADSLIDRYGMLDDSQRRLIRNYQAQGNLEQAQVVMLQAVEDRAEGAADRINKVAAAWERLKKWTSDKVDQVGEKVGDTISPSRDAEIAALEEGLSGSRWATAKRARKQARLDELRGAESDDGIQKWALGVRTEFNRLSTSVGDFARSVDPALAATDALENKEKLLAKAVDLTVLPQQEATRLLGLYRRQLIDALDPAQAFANEVERQARVLEAAAGRARDFEQQRQQILQKRGAQPGDSLKPDETAKINAGLDRKYAVEAADRHRTAQEAIQDAKALGAATATLSQPAIIAAQAQATFFDVLRKTSDYKKAKQAEDDAYAKGMVEWSAQVDASVKTSSLAVDAARRLAVAQAQGGDIAAAQAQAQNVYAEQVARGVDPVRALTLATADYQKSLASIAGQQAAWNRDLGEQIAAAGRLAQAEGVSAAAVAEATVQNRVRAQVLKEGVALESDRARTIEAGTRALEAQAAAARVNNTIRSQNQDLTLARAEFALLGASNAERERQIALLKATLEVQDSADWQQVPRETRDAWVAQAGAVAEYQARIADATETSRDFANVITSGFEDAILSGGKLTDIVQSLGKDIERVFLRGFVTKPLESFLTGNMTKLLAGEPAGDSQVKPVTATDPGGYKALFDKLAGGANPLGSQSNPMWVRLFGPSSGLDISAPADGSSLPVAIKDGGGIIDMLRSEARAQGVPEEVALSLAKIESNFQQFRPDGSVLTSSAGAQGVMQLMPGTAAWLGVDATDTRENVRGGIKYLAMLGRQFGGDWTTAVGAYNAGPTRMNQYLDQGRALDGETVQHMEKFGATVKTVSADVLAMREPVQGVTVAQERQLQAQLDALPVLRAVNDSTETLTSTQRSWVDSALGLTAATDTAGTSIAVTARAMDTIPENAISAAEGFDAAATGIGSLGEAATEGADTLLGGIKSIASGIGGFFDDLFSGGSTSQAQKVIKNADGSTSFVPSAQGVGGSWLNQPAITWGSGPTSRQMEGIDDAGQLGYAPGTNPASSTSWGQLIQGVGGIAAGIATATKKGATTGQIIGGGLMGVGSAVAMIPSPGITQVVGGVMMAAGALLNAVSGAKDRGEAYSRSNITLGANGKYALGTYAADNDGNPTQFNGDASKIAKGLNDIAARLNLTPTTGSSYIDSKNKSAEEAAVELLKGMQSSVPNVAYALAHETAVSLEDMLQHLEFANSFDQQIKALRSSVSDLFAQFQSGVDAANSFGKTISDIIDNAFTVFAVPKGASLPGFATGTLSAPAGWAVVGEEGPELVNLQGGERIWNARESAQMIAGLGQGRDDTLIHLRSTDELAKVRRALGMRGKVNPSTGLLGFDDSGDGVGSDNSPGGERDTPGSGTSQGVTGSGYGADADSDGVGGVLDTVSGWMSAVTGFMSAIAGWQADTEANTEAQSTALAGIAGLGMTAVAASLSAVASELGPGLTGFLEGITGEKGTAPAVGHDYGDMGEGGVSATAGTIGERAVASAGGGSYRGASADVIDDTLAALAAAIKADPTGELSAGLVGASRLPGAQNATVQQIADAPWKIFEGSSNDSMGALADLDTAAQQLLSATGQIPDVLRRALDGANAYAVSLGITPATATRQIEQEQAQQRADALQTQFDAVGLARTRVAELNDIIKSLGDNTFSPIGKDFDQLAADMRTAATAYTAAGQAVPDGLFAAQRQMETLGAARKRLLDEVAGTTIETSPEEKKVEQLRGQWSTTATDLVKAFALVGIVGDDLAARLNEGFGNALRKEQDSYSDTNAATLRKVRGEDGYDSAVALADSYETAISDVNALWAEGADRARETGVVTATLDESLLALVKSGSVTSKSLKELQAVYADQPAVLAAVTAALDELTAAAARQQALTIRGATTTFETALDPSYRPPLTAATALADAGVTADLGGFTTDLNNFTAALARGSAGAADARFIFNQLTGQFQSGKITGDEYNALVGSISQGWTTAANAAQTLAAYQADLNSRMFASVGSNRMAGLLSLDQQQASELAQARAAGHDTTQLVQIQGAERGQKSFELARQDVYDWYDREIAARQEQITSLQEGAVAAAQVAKQFRSAYEALALNDASPLSASQRLDEARTQFEAAYGTATSSTATDTERTAAQSTLQSLGPQLVQLAQAYFANSDTTDYDRVRSVFDELGTLTGGLDTAEQDLQTAQDSLKELQRQRAEVTRIGERQLGSLADITSVLNQSYAVWQGALTPLQQLTGTSSSATVAQMTAGLTAASLPSVMTWARGQGASTVQQVLVAADKQLGWTNNPYRYAAPSDVATMEGTSWTPEVSLSWLGQHGYSGAWDSNANAYIQAYGLGDQYTAFLRQWKADHAVPGYATGTLSTPPGAKWVGENGPELLWEDGGAAVASSADSMRIASLWQAAANDRGLPSIVASLQSVAPAPAARSGPGGDAALVAMLERKLDAVTARLDALRAERSRDARGQIALTEDVANETLAGQERIAAALRLQQDMERAA